MRLDKHIELPAYKGNLALTYDLPVDNFFTGEVQIWYVPKTYSSDGWYVSYTPDGAIPEWPAVSPAEAQMLVQYKFKKADDDNESLKPSVVDPLSIEIYVEEWKPAGNE